ncbi:Na+/H+ antiporter subunit E [Phyllobacterium leguminum]|uniref:Multisubunit potassium/proton antiporter PhaE subunit n=1 Tax=Phyllobacterium leguminum TaxID=314237 RepID=A0A318TA25_9HYPH|nr:Na+/H+ antiporter subunit E [Phyllobacterium leguminum]PYE90514.1 multisubunit potassium/proton antiporter PhaE subunit [Phyllobacterium leguminum]
MTRLLPYPLLSLSLLVMWLLLNGVSAGQFALGWFVAIFASWSMRALKPSKPRIRCWRMIPVLFVRVFIDVIGSNIDAARLILIPGKRPRSAFLRIRLALRDPTGLSALAVILTAMPGTAWIEYNARSGELLLHVLDMHDRRYWRELIKKRYEQPLREIFGEIGE